MKQARALLFSASVLTLLLAASSPAQQGKVALAHLLNPAGEKIGVATLTEGRDGVVIAVNLRGLSPGLHAFHIHAVGKAEPPTFKTAGGHFNPYGKSHGRKNPHGLHAGDLPNLLVGPDGVGAALFTAPLVTLGSGANSLFDADGSAIVIHAGPDDNNPGDDPQDTAGNAGKRVACGVIKWLE